MTGDGQTTLEKDWNSKESFSLLCEKKNNKQHKQQHVNFNGGVNKKCQKKSSEFSVEQNKTKEREKIKEEGFDITSETARPLLRRDLLGWLGSFGTNK